MRILVKLLPALALALLALAGWLHYQATSTLQAHRWIPLRQAIQIKPGVVLEAPFRTDLNDWYTISLDADRQIPARKLDCLLGIQSALGPPCPFQANGVSMKWVVRRAGRTLAWGSSGTYGGSYWGPTVGREIGRFRPDRDDTYTLQVESETEGAQLNAANPKIVIAINSKRFKGVFVSAQLESAASLICAGLGVALLMGLTVWHVYRKRKR